MKSSTFFLIFLIILASSFATGAGLGLLGNIELGAILFYVPVMISIIGFYIVKLFKAFPLGASILFDIVSYGALDAMIELSLGLHTGFQTDLFGIASLPGSIEISPGWEILFPLFVGFPLLVELSKRTLGF